MTVEMWMGLGIVVAIIGFIMWVLAVMLLHFGFSVCSVSSGLPGGNFIQIGRASCRERV